MEESVDRAKIEAHNRIRRIAIGWGGEVRKDELQPADLNLVADLQRYIKNRKELAVTYLDLRHDSDRAVVITLLNAYDFEIKRLLNLI